MKIKKEAIIKLLSRFGKIKKNLKNFNFIESGFIDSINLLRLISDIEIKFKVNIDNKYTNSKNFGDLNDLVKHINKLLK